MYKIAQTLTKKTHTEIVFTTLELKSGGVCFYINMRSRNARTNNVDNFSSIIISRKVSSATIVARNTTGECVFCDLEEFAQLYLQQMLKHVKTNGVNLINIISELLNTSSSCSDFIPRFSEVYKNTEFLCETKLK